MAGLVALPASPDTLVRYIDALAGHKAPATIRRYLSSIATFHRAAQLDNPCAAIAVGLALKRLHREQGRAQIQAAPLIRSLVDRLLAAAGPDMKGRRDRALLALAYDTLCRRSELVALRVADIEAGTEGDATVLVARSKTDQEGVGMVRHGVELPAVMQAGGWRTAEMVGRYTRRLDARRSGAAKLAILQNRT